MLVRYFQKLTIQIIYFSLKYVEKLLNWTTFIIFEKFMDTLFYWIKTDEFEKEA
jgi:hypothetical protein